MKCYAFRDPDGSYRQKNSTWWQQQRAEKTADLTLKSLYYSRGSLRNSLNGLNTPSVAAVVLAPPRPAANEYDREVWRLYYRELAEAHKRRKTIPTDELFALYAKDGYQVIEIEINLP